MRRGGQEKRSWTKKLLRLSTFRGYPEKARPNIEGEEWSRKQVEGKGKEGKREFQEVKERQNVKVAK